VLGAYTAAFERIEQRLEDFDAQAMRGDGSDKDIELLIDMRHEVGNLRRALAAHRSALVALTHPELEALGSKGSGERFESLFSRFEAVLQEARDARERSSAPSTS
jgi:CorA-like Mg2+ transporter protein.